MDVDLVNWTNTSDETCPEFLKWFILAEACFDPILNNQSVPIAQQSFMKRINTSMQFWACSPEQFLRYICMDQDLEQLILQRNRDGQSVFHWAMQQWSAWIRQKQNFAN
jgi:hypothetical protein